ncbi:MAG: hypothetical protein WKG07_11020 [Hymenobacter sp.]
MSIGTLVIPGFTVVSAATISLVVPASVSNVGGAITVVTPGGTATSATAFNIILAARAKPGSCRA